ncbi:unnamed protein product [Schistosoma turkestanicum]|nr:unnamed protein product [Schistosoma turkestanicum]
MEDICHKILDLYPADGNTGDEQVGSTTTTTTTATATATPTTNNSNNNNNSHITKRELPIHHHSTHSMSFDSSKYQGIHSRGGEPPPVKRQALMRSTGSSNVYASTTVHTGSSSSGDNHINSSHVTAPMINDSAKLMKHVPYPAHYRPPSDATVHNNNSNNNNHKIPVYK